MSQNGRQDDMPYSKRCIRCYLYYWFLTGTQPGHDISSLLEIRFFHAHDRSYTGNITPHLISMCVWSPQFTNDILCSGNFISKFIILFFFKDLVCFILYVALSIFGNWNKHTAFMAKLPKQSNNTRLDILPRTTSELILYFDYIFSSWCRV